MTLKTCSSFTNHPNVNVEWDPILAGEACPMCEALVVKEAQPDPPGIKEELEDVEGDISSAQFSIERILTRLRSKQAEASRRVRANA